MVLLPSPPTASRLCSERPLSRARRVAARGGGERRGVAPTGGRRMATARPARRAAGSSTVCRPPLKGAPLRPHALLAERRTTESSTGRYPPWGGARLRPPSPTPAHRIRTRHIRAPPHPPALLPTTSATARRRIHTLVPVPPGPCSPRTLVPLLLHLGAVEHLETRASSVASTP
jgi:hypothetical protein